MSLFTIRQKADVPAKIYLYNKLTELLFYPNQKVMSITCESVSAGTYRVSHPFGSLTNRYRVTIGVVLEDL